MGIKVQRTSTDEPDKIISGEDTKFLDDDLLVVVDDRLDEVEEANPIRYYNWNNVDYYEGY